MSEKALEELRAVLRIIRDKMPQIQAGEDLAVNAYVPLDLLIEDLAPDGELGRRLLPKELAEGLIGGWVGEKQGSIGILSILVDYESTGSVQLDQRVRIVAVGEEP